MSFTKDMLEGVAGMIQTAGIAVLTAPNTVIAPVDTAISFKTMPQTPDRVVVLTGYQVRDAVSQSFSRLGLQVLSRGNPGDALDADDLGDSIFQLLQGVTAVQMGSIWIVQILREYSLPTGEDADRRWTRSDKYFVDANPPATAYRQ